MHTGSRCLSRTISRSVHLLSESSSPTDMEYGALQQHAALRETRKGPSEDTGPAKPLALILRQLYQRRPSDVTRFFVLHAAAMWNENNYRNCCEVRASRTPPLNSACGTALFSRSPAQIGSSVIKSREFPEFTTFETHCPLSGLIVHGLGARKRRRRFAPSDRRPWARRFTAFRNVKRRCSAAQTSAGIQALDSRREKRYKIYKVREKGTKGGKDAIAQ